MKFRILPALLLCLATALPAAAEDPTRVAMTRFKALFPATTFTSFTQAPIRGLYEVRTEMDTFYFAAEEGHLVFGEIWDRTGENLTRPSGDTGGRRAEPMAEPDPQSHEMEDR
jgi:hypothetical protein